MKKEYANIINYKIALYLLLIGVLGAYLLPSFLNLFEKRMFIYNIAFSEDGTIVGAEYPFYLWNIDSNSAISTKHVDEINHGFNEIQFSSNNKYIARIIDNMNKIIILNKDDLSEVVEISGQKGIFSQDGKEYYFTNAVDNIYSINVYNIENKTSTIKYRIFRPMSTDFSPELNIVSSINSNNIITISSYFDYDYDPLFGSNDVSSFSDLVIAIRKRDTTIKKRIYELMSDDERIFIDNLTIDKKINNDQQFKIISILNNIISTKTLDISDDSKTINRRRLINNRKIIEQAFPKLIVCKKDFTLMVNEINGKLRNSKYFISSKYKDGFYSTNGKTYLYGVSGCISIDNESKNIKQFYGDWISESGIVKISNDGKMIAKIKDLSRLQIWDIENNKLINEIKLPKRMNFVRALSFSQNNNAIAIGTPSRAGKKVYYKGEIQIYEVKTGRLLKILKPGKVINVK